jgi:hypothetical protein
MGEYGPATTLVDRLIAHAGAMTIEEAVDLYRARAARLLVQGAEAERRALAQARRAAAVAGLADEYERARHAAASAWRSSLPETRGPWLLVGEAIASAAGGLVVNDTLDDKAFQMLVGPWRQAIGTMTPVGPGPIRERIARR